MTKPVHNWEELLDAYFGNVRRGKPKRQETGRRPRMISEELLIYYKWKGYSNRQISAELGIPRRTIDNRINKLLDEGKLIYVSYKNYLTNGGEPY